MVNISESLHFVCFFKCAVVFKVKVAQINQDIFQWLFPHYKIYLKVLI